MRLLAGLCCFVLSSSSVLALCPRFIPKEIPRNIATTTPLLTFVTMRVRSNRFLRVLCLEGGSPFLPLGASGLQHKSPRSALFTTAIGTSTTLFADPLYSNNNNNSSSSNNNTTQSSSSSSNNRRSLSSDSTKTYRLDGRGLGTRVQATTNTGHSIATDIPKSMGGGDTSPQPVETLLASWMGCTQATATFVGRQLLMQRTKRPRAQVRLEFDKIQAHRDERGALELPIQKTPSIPSRLQRITGTIKVSLVLPTATAAATATEALLFDSNELEILKEQTEARCPIANMIVESGCAMEVEWIQDDS